MNIFYFYDRNWYPIVEQFSPLTTQLQNAKATTNSVNPLTAIVSSGVYTIIVQSVKKKTTINNVLTKIYCL